MPEYDDSYGYVRPDIAIARARLFEMTQAEKDEANAIIIPEGAKLKWSDELNKMVWE